MADAARLQALYGQVTSWLEAHGIAVASMWSEHFNVSWLVRMAQEVSGRLNTTIGFWFVVVVYVILGLLEVGDIERRIRRLPNSETVQALLDGSAATAAKLRKYMLIRTTMSAATGALVWAFSVLIGLQLAAEWGVIAFALNYIPFIGPFIATMFPTLFALVQFGSWQMALVVFACLNLIQFVIGSYLEPSLSGKALAISPFIVLLAVFFCCSLARDET